MLQGGYVFLVINVVFLQLYEELVQGGAWIIDGSTRPRKCRIISNVHSMKHSDQGFSAQNQNNFGPFLLLKLPFSKDTSPKFNIAPENRPSQKEGSLGTIILERQTVKLPRV